MKIVQTRRLKEDIFGDAIDGDHNELELNIKTDVKKNENCVNSVNIRSRVDSDIGIGIVDDQSVK